MPTHEAARTANSCRHGLVPCGLQQAAGVWIWVEQPPSIERGALAGVLTAGTVSDGSASQRVCQRMGPTAPTPLLACVPLAEASRRSLPFSRGAHPHPPSLTFRDLLASLIGDAVLIRRPHSRRGGASLCHAGGRGAARSSSAAHRHLFPRRGRFGAGSARPVDEWGPCSP